MPRFPGAQPTYSIPNAVVIGGDSINPQPQGYCTRLLLANDCTPAGLEPASHPSSTVALSMGVALELWETLLYSASSSA